MNITYAHLETLIGKKVEVIFHDHADKIPYAVYTQAVGILLHVGRKKGDSAGCIVLTYWDLPKEDLTNRAYNQEKFTICKNDIIEVYELKRRN